MVETFSLPDEAPAGGSLRTALTELQDGMREGFLLAHPESANDLASPPLEPARPCTYGAAISLLRGFVQDYQISLAADHEYKSDDFSKTTMDAR